MNSIEKEHLEKRKHAISLGLVTAYLHDLPYSVRHDHQLLDAMSTLVDEMLHVRTYGVFYKKAEAVSKEYAREIGKRFTARFVEAEAADTTTGFDSVTTRATIMNELVPEITERLTAVRISTHSYPDLHGRLAQACGLYVADRLRARGSQGRPVERGPSI